MPFPNHGRLIGADTAGRNRLLQQPPAENPEPFERRRVERDPGSFSGSLSSLKLAGIHVKLEGLTPVLVLVLVLVLDL